jgi:PQQ-like domain
VRTPAGTGRAAVAAPPLDNIQASAREVCQYPGFCRIFSDWNRARFTPFLTFSSRAGADWERPAQRSEGDSMRIASRLTVLAAVAVAGLGLTAAMPAAAIPAGASLTPHTRTVTTALGRAVGTRTVRTTGAALATPLWVSRLLLKNGGTAGYAVAASPGGSTVFATGTQRLPHEITRGVTVAYNATTGARIWQTEDTTGTVSGFSSIAVSPDSSTVFVTGYGNPVSRTERQIVTVAYNAATGAVLWTQEVGSHATGGVSVKVSPDGSTVFMAGIAECGKPIGACYVTVAYNAATGTAVWTQELENSGVASSLAVSPDGSAVAVTGSALSQGSNVFTTIAYNAATGATLWTASYPVQTSGSAPAVAMSGTAVFVTGTVIPAPNTTSYRTIAYSASSGTQMWQESFTKERLGNASALAVSPDGSTVFVTGDVDSTPGVSEFGTVAYDAATGARLWKAFFQAGGGATALAVSPGGSRVFVTGDGSSPKFGNPQYATVAYDAGTGARAWAAHYGDAALGASYAYGLAVSPDGSKVFVTGGNLSYLTTLAYRS